MRDCFICNTNNFVLFYGVVDNQDYVTCSNCKLIFVDKIADQEEIYSAYDGGFFKSSRRKIMNYFRSFNAQTNLKSSVERASKIFKYASSFLNENSNQPRFLDIGCNKGYLLSVAAENGFNIYGIEIVPEIIVPFRKKYPRFNPQVHSGSFNENFQKLPTGSFDIITAIDVIEHLLDPAEEMAKIYSLLKPGGSFVIQTPDGACQRAKDEKEEWGALKPLEHLQVYSEDNLKIFSEKLGYSKIEFHKPFDDADGNFVAAMTK